MMSSFKKPMILELEHEHWSTHIVVIMFALVTFGAFALSMKTDTAHLRLRKEKIIKFSKSAFPFRFAIHKFHDITDVFAIQPSERQLYQYWSTNREGHWSVPSWGNYICMAKERNMSLMVEETEFNISNHRCDATIARDKNFSDTLFQWNYNRDQEQRNEEYLNFHCIYVNFVKEVVAPLMGGGRILYQRAPTLRCYVPGEPVPMGSLHCDEDYHHQPSEINFWMPLSEHVFDTNTLWVESTPMYGDFHPLDLQYGECYSGYLNKCRHYTKANDSNTTRLSLDFRVVSEASGGHDPLFHKGIRRGAKAKFQRVFDVGGFYSELDTPSQQLMR